MDTMPANDAMENPPHTPLAGLDPADLLRQGAAEDTIMDGAASPFYPPPIEELAPLFPQIEILELIGKGGMGAVYKVRQKELDRIVALKILPPAIGQSPAFTNRFTREAKALAKLNHPGIVTIHEFGQTSASSSSQPSTLSHQPLPYILMEFVDGMNLAQLMKAGRISPREALAIVPQICDALQFAHDQGIVHRDIKPENILLDRLGRVKVADFGIAKVVESVCDRPDPDEERRSQTAATVDETIAGKIIGTPAYMAPEQIDHPSEVDHRADIYALGVVFYQMLTGELPGGSIEGPSKKVRIDVRLDEIVLQAMERNPEMRFQQASVMRTRVDELDNPPVIPQAPKRGMMRRWWWMFLVMLPLGLLIGFGAGSVWFYITPKKYEATSTIEIVAPAGTATTPSLFATQFEVIKSQESLGAVAEQLELSKKWMLSQDSVVRTLRGMISTQNIRGTDLISIRVRNTNKLESAAIANAVTLTYQRKFPGRSVIHEMALEPAAPISPNLRLTLVAACLGGLLLSPLAALVLMMILQWMFPEAKRQVPTAMILSKPNP